MKKNRKGLSFYGLCLIVGLIPMGVTSILLSVLSLSLLQKNVKSGVKDLLMVAASNVEQYFAYDLVVNGDVDYEEYADHEFIESQQKNHVELTLFKRNIRFMSSLKDDSGNYVEGTDMPADAWVAISAGDTYYVENFSVMGVPYFVCYVPVYDAEGKIWGAAFAGQPTSVYEAILKSSVANLLLVVVALAIIATVVVLIGARKISGTVTKLEGDLRQLSTGDLNADFTSKSNIKELENLADCSATLQAKLSEIIGKVKDTSDSLNATAMNVDELSVNAADGAGKISDAVTELATTAQGMATTVQDANATIMEMGDVIDVIAGSVSTMVENSKETKAATEKAVNAMDKLQAASNKSAESIESIRSQVNETYEAVEGIKAAVDAISSISSETNLLALNASIEAARAGEAGRGFAVVAENIKNLAEGSNESAEQIQNIINHIIEVSEKSVQMADSIGVILEEQNAALKDAYTQMEESKNSNSKLGEGVDAVGTQAEALSKIKDSVLNNISDLSAVSEENAASSEEVNASVETIANAVADTKTEAAEVKAIAGKLIEEMAYFK